MDKELQRKYMLVAGAHNIGDVLDLLKYLAEKAADIRTSLGIKNDSIEIREALHNYLKISVDSIRKIKDNKVQPRSDTSSISREDDDL